MVRPTFLALLLACTVPVQAASARCDGELAEDRIRRVGEHGDLLTEAGRTLRLADLRLEEGARARLAGFEGAAVALQLAGASDRWGAVPARIVVSRDGTDLAALLVAEGLALVDASVRDGLCRPALLTAETEPRRARRGIWAATPIAASDPEAIAGRAGRFTVIEGRIVSVGERARWVYLNFGRDFGRDFAVSISRRKWEAMRLAGLSAEALKGRHVRVRGIVEMRRAPGIEIASADMIEWRDVAGPGR